MKDYTEKEVNALMEKLMSALGVEDEEEVDAGKQTAETYWKWYQDFLSVGFTKEQAFTLVRDLTRAFQGAWLIDKGEDDGEEI